MKTIISRSLFALLCILVFTPASVYAHTGVGHAAGFANGFGHPIGGFDHVLAMVAVGIWASQIGGKAVWAVPATFVGVMVLGCILGITGVSVPLVEEGIVISVLIFGVLIAAAVRMPLAVSMAIVGLFAIFHGHAHGAEMPVAVSGLAYGVGFAVATALLHISGIFIGVLFRKTARMQFIRLAGATITAGGVYLFFA
jgi:urease accessory protein